MHLRKLGVLAAIGAGKIWIDMSTVSPAVSRGLAEAVRAKGGDLVDAPVSGSVSLQSSAADDSGG